MKNKFEIFYKFVKYYPLSHALVRGMESVLFSQQRLAHPILDIGCGDGKFALLTFGKEGIDLGLDISKVKLTEAKKIGAYKKTLLADTRKVPIRDSYFGSIISVSVFEHIKNVSKVLTECSRLLVEGGSLVFAVPCRESRKYLFWPKIFGKYYLNLIDNLMGHYPFYDKKDWIKMLKKAGFSDIQIIPYFPKKIVYLFDLLLPSGFFYHFTGKVFGPRRLIAKIFQPYFYLDQNDGVGYFIRAKKN